MNILESFVQNWEQSNFPPKGNPILLAVSGGKDSITLAHILYDLGYNFSIAHCNFQLRGDESLGDENFVREWCSTRNIKLHITKFDTAAAMQSLQMGVQEAARKLRYDWFSQLVNEHHYHAILTAHHANDNAETLLMNFFKGTGLSGLHGIKPKNGNIIRPLLFMNKQTIDAYINDHQIPFREDSSNVSTKYLRNAVRHNIIPAIQKQFPGVVDTLNQNIKRFASAEKLYHDSIKKEIDTIMEKRGADYFIPILKLKRSPYIEALVYEIFTSFGFSTAQLPFIQNLTDAETGKYVIADNYTVIKNRNFLVITANTAADSEHILINSGDEIIPLPTGKLILSTLAAQPSTLSTDNNSIYLDASKISLPLMLRHRKAGDYFYPIGMGMKKKKISKYLSDSKVALHHKNNFWILESMHKIVWLVGLRMDERFKVKESSQKIIKISFVPN